MNKNKRQGYKINKEEEDIKKEDVKHKKEEIKYKKKKEVTDPARHMPKRSLSGSQSSYHSDLVQPSIKAAESVTRSS